MDDRAQRRAAFLADLERAIRRRKLRMQHGAHPPTIPAIVNTAMLAAVNQVRRDVAARRPAH